jgi:hypothetical protein
MRKKLYLNSHPTGVRGKKQVNQTYSKFYHKSPGLASLHELALEPKCKPSGYQKLINFVISGDLESAKEYIEKAGYSGVLAEFLLGNAELDAKLETLAAVMPCGGCNE